MCLDTHALPLETWISVGLRLAYVKKLSGTYLETNIKSLLKLKIDQLLMELYHPLGIYLKDEVSVT